MELQKLTVPTYFEPNVLNTFSVRRGIKNSSLQRMYEALVKRRSSLEQNPIQPQLTHVKLGVGWLRCSLRLPSPSSLESNQTHMHIEIKPPEALDRFYFVFASD